MSSPTTTALMQLTPDSCVLFFTLGVLLIYIELNRPGSILPGTVGLLLTLFAVAPLFHQHLSVAAILTIMGGVLLLARALRRSTSAITPVIATICLVFGLLHLVQGAQSVRVHAATAVPCGLVLGVGTSILTRIARRARLNKGLDLGRARTSRPGAFKS
jgi:membrane-bound serine protease (ClpP class)